jgi:hypothetical protein
MAEPSVEPVLREPAPAASSLPRPPAHVPRAAGHARAWVLGPIAFIALIAASIVSIGLAAVVWVPLLLGIGIAMIVVAAARRKRQASQGRNGSEVKDPEHAHPRWPRNVVDDRLPEP